MHCNGEIIRYFEQQQHSDVCIIQWLSNSKLYLTETDRSTRYEVIQSVLVRLHSIRKKNEKESRKHDNGTERK